MPGKTKPSHVEGLSVQGPAATLQSQFDFPRENRVSIRRLMWGCGREKLDSVCLDPLLRLETEGTVA